MLTIVTGTPGAGKTAWALSQAVSLASSENRPLYVAGVRGLNLESIPCEAYVLDDPMVWFECPEGAIVLLDEGQEWFRVRPQGAQVPLAVQKMERHRHQGFDLFITTQAPTLIDTNVRKLCGRHIHVQALPTGSHATLYEYLEVQHKPTDWHTKKQATSVKAWHRPSDVFSWYESTALVTGAHKRKIPAGFWLRMAPVVLVLGWLGWSWYQDKGIFGFFDQAEADTSAQIDPGSPLPVASEFRGPSPAGTVRSSTNGDPGDRLTPAQWATLWKPRVHALPWSAPAYDDVFQARDFPRPHCIIVHDHDGGVEDCRCLTQQATKLVVPIETCVGFVESGFFDPTLERQIVERAGARGEEGGSRPRAPYDQSQNHTFGETKLDIWGTNRVK